MSQAEILSTPRVLPADRSRVSLETKEVCQLLCCFLPVSCVGRVAQCSTTLRAVAYSDDVWKPRVTVLLGDYADVRVDQDFADTVAFEERFRCLSAHVPVWRFNQAVERYNGCGYESLRKLGTLTRPGTKDAHFAPFAELTFPIRTQAALELLRCFSEASGKGMNVYDRVASLLDKASLQASLRNVKSKQAPRLQKDKRSSERFGAFLLSPWPKTQYTSGTSSSTAPPVLLVKAAGKTRAERNSERAYARKAASRAVTKLQRDEARLRLAHERAAREEVELQAVEAVTAGQASQQQVLLSDLSLAQRQLRTSERQLEDVGSKTAKIIAEFKRQRDAAIKARDEQSKRCEGYVTSERAAAKMLEKVHGLRSSAAVVDAERRAAAATVEAERLERAVVSLQSERDSERSTAKSRQSQLREAFLSQRARADSALESVDVLETRGKIAATDMAQLQCDLTAAFAKNETDREQSRAAQALAVTQAKCEAEVAVAKAKREAEVAAAAAEVSQVKEQMVHAVLDDPKNLSPNSGRILSAAIAAIPPGETRTLRNAHRNADGKRSHRGGLHSVMGIHHPYKKASKVSKKTLRRRGKVFTSSAVQLAGGEDEVPTFVLEHAKSHPKIYNEIGLKLTRKLSIEETAALCNETSGSLGAAVRRHLQRCGIDVATKAQVNEYFKESWERFETGMITTPDPKHRSKLLTGAWLQVSNIMEVMQRMMERFHTKGALAWESNIPADECWFELIIDKGSSATKLVMEYCCIDAPDSVRNVSLVGVLDRVKDAYDMMSAFKPIFEQVNEINSRGTCIWTP
eukprot:6199215-Pleurochrysis_carterae.AAC.2